MPRQQIVAEEDTRSVVRALQAALRDAVRAQGLTLDQVRVDWKLNDKDELVVAAIVQPRCEGEWLVLLSDEQAKRRYRRQKTKPPGHGFW